VLAAPVFSWHEFNLAPWPAYAIRRSCEFPYHSRNLLLLSVHLALTASGPRPNVPLFAIGAENQAVATSEGALNLVTGGTGLLGSHIAEQLVRRGRRVRALVRHGSDVRFLRSLGVELFEGDLSDAASLERATQGVGVVYHAAARVGDWGPWAEFVEGTIEGTRRLLSAAIKAHVPRFIHVSSISAYGHPNRPGLVIDESAPLGQELHHWSYYSRAKVEAEKLVWDAHRRGDIAVTVIRPSWLYGPRDRATMARLCDSIRTKRVKLLGDGENRLNVVHAGNVAEAAILAADSPRAPGEAFNCSNDGVLTQKKYFNLVAETLGEPPVTKRVPYGVAYFAGFVAEFFGHLFHQKRPPLITRYSVWLIGRKTFFECQKARDVLGWRSSVPYEEGIPQAVKAYLGERKSGEGAALVAAGA
jgi:nucleoside-diphosphate-sugar epimerase